MRESIKYLLGKIKSEYFILLILILTNFSSFGLGRLSKLEENKTPLKIISATENKQDNNTLKKYIASKNGSKYHLPWCSGAQTISEKNKIWFDSQEEAERAGYSPASNCKGI